MMAKVNMLYLSRSSGQLQSHKGMISTSRDELFNRIILPTRIPHFPFGIPNPIYNYGNNEENSFL
jgi:hypothetical protein